MAGDLVVTRLRTIRWTVAASPQYAAKLGQLRRWTDARWVGFTEAAAGIAPARWLSRHVRGADPVVSSGSLVVQASVVAQGLAVALLPEPSLEHFGLVPARLGRSLRDAADTLPVDELYLVTHRALRRVPRVAVTWDLLLERLAEPR